jgi:WXG100 family type VII secretion target
MAAGGMFRTELPALQAGSQRMLEANQQIQQQINGLLARLEPLMGSWQGTASVSFHQVKQRWHELTAQHNQRLAAIGEGISSNQVTYATTEDANRQQFSHISGAMGG